MTPKRRKHSISSIQLAALCLSMVAWTATAGSALASEFDIQRYCGQSDTATMKTLASQLEGDWRAHYQGGYVVMGDRVMPHPASGETEHGRLVSREDGLALLPSGQGEEMMLHWALDETWRIGEHPTLPEGTRPVPGIGDLPDPNVDGLDLAILAGCDLNDLPRMTGSGSMTRQGVTADFTLRAIVIDSDLIYGFQEIDATAQGMHVMERRPMVMQRD